VPQLIDGILRRLPWLALRAWFAIAYVVRDPRASTNADAGRLISIRRICRATGVEKSRVVDEAVREILQFNLVSGVFRHGRGGGGAINVRAFIGDPGNVPPAISSSGGDRPFDAVPIPRHMLPVLANCYTTAAYSAALISVVIRCTRLDRGRLVEYRGRNGARLSSRFVTETFGISRRAAIDALKRAELEGWIERDVRPGDYSERQHGPITRLGPRFWNRDGELSGADHRAPRICTPEFAPKNCTLQVAKRRKFAPHIHGRPSVRGRLDTNGGVRGVVSRWGGGRSAPLVARVDLTEPQRILDLYRAAAANSWWGVANTEHQRHRFFATAVAATCCAGDRNNPGPLFIAKLRAMAALDRLRDRNATQREIGEFMQSGGCGGKTKNSILVSLTEAQDEAGRRLLARALGHTDCAINPDAETYGRVFRAWRAGHQGEGLHEIQMIGMLQDDTRDFTWTLSRMRRARAAFESGGGNE